MLVYECATHQLALISPVKQFITATNPNQREHFNVYECFKVAVVTTKFTEAYSFIQEPKLGN